MSTAKNLYFCCLLLKLLVYNLIVVSSHSPPIDTLFAHQSNNHKSHLVLYTLKPLSWLHLLLDTIE